MTQIPAMSQRVESIELFRLDAVKPRHYSFGTWNSRQHAVIKLCADGCSGWGENRMGVNGEVVDLAAWGACFRRLPGMPVSAALETTRAVLDSWRSRRREMAEIALLDLAGRVAGKPSIELLGLTRREPVAGLFCILESDPVRVTEMAHRAIERGLRTHVKVKLFGDVDLDVKIVKAARQVLGEDAFLVGDVNEGYGSRAGDEPLRVLAASLLQLYEAGLDACEDPAAMGVSQWRSLQTMVQPLALIPDIPLRPAGAAAETIRPGMGQIYNIHPGDASSMIDSITLAGRVRAIGGRVMIGDDSFIGPAPTQWQQLAIGLGAAWVEALDRPEECRTFLNAVQSRATGQTGDGRIGLLETAAGFGLEVDEDRLRREAVDHVLLTESS